MTKQCMIIMNAHNEMSDSKIGKNFFLQNLEKSSFQFGVNEKLLTQDISGHVTKYKLL